MRRLGFTAIFIIFSMLSFGPGVQAAGWCQRFTSLASLAHRNVERLRPVLLSTALIASGVIVYSKLQQGYKAVTYSMASPALSGGGDPLVLRDSKGGALELRSDLDGIRFDILQSAGAASSLKVFARDQEIQIPLSVISPDEFEGEDSSGVKVQLKISSGESSTSEETRDFGYWNMGTPLIQTDSSGFLNISYPLQHWEANNQRVRVTKTPREFHIILSSESGRQEWSGRLRDDERVEVLSETK